MALVGHISGSSQSSSVIGISGSVIIANRPQSLFPSLPSDASFYVSGSTSATTGKSVFGGDLISSGSFNLKSGTGGISQFSVSSIGMLLNTTAGVNTINIAASTGNITTSGDIAVNGGDLTTTSGTATLFNTGATNLAIGSAATALLMGSAAGTVTVNGDLKVSGNDIQSSTATAITLSGADVAIAGDLTVTGNDIKSSTATVFTMAGANVTAAGNVVVSGDLTVNGTTVTVDATTLTIEDPIVGLGFTSGSVDVTAGDRGWVGGLSGADNAAMAWLNTPAEFVVARTTATAASTTIPVSSYGNFHANDIQGNIISASLGFSGSLTRLMDGTSYIIAGNNITVTSASNGAVTITGPASGAPTNAQYLVLVADGTLSDERAFVAGTGLSAVDGGAGLNYTLGINDSVVATISGSTFTGAVKFNQGLSGSLTKLVDGTSYLVAGSGISIASSSNGPVTISTGAGVGDVVGPASATAGAVALFDGTTGKLLKNSSLTTADGGASLFINSNLYVTGSTTFGDTTSDTVSFTARVATDLLPVGDVAQNLGSVDNRWANIYTGDLHLRNDRGDFTLIEEENFLSIRFNKTGKRYKFVLEAVPELDEPPVLKF